MEHRRSPGSPLVCRSKGLKKSSLQKTAAGAIVLQAVGSYKETVESNLKVGKFIPIILLQHTEKWWYIVLESVCFA